MQHMDPYATVVNCLYEPKRPKKRPAELLCQAPVSNQVANIMSDKRCIY